MKKTTFVGNLAAWVAVGVVCCAFLGWWHLSDGIPSVQSSAVQLGVVLAAPLLLYAIGAIIGLAVLWFKKILVSRITKRVCRVISIAVLAFVLAAGLPALIPATGEALLGPAVVVVYVAMAAPLLLVVLGVVYAVGCAGANEPRKSEPDV